MKICEIQGWLAILFVGVVILGNLVFSDINAQEQYSIPSWVKGVAGFWAENKITDVDFVEALSFLVNEEIIKIPEMELLKQRVVQLESKNTQLKNQLDGSFIPIQTNSSTISCGFDEIMVVEGVCVNAFDDESLSNILSISTDKSVYDDGDIIRIIGTIQNLEEIIPVTVLLYDPTGNIISISQVLPSSDGGDFFHSITTNGTMKDSGIYEVRAQYGAQKTSTTFSFTASGFIPPPLEPEPVPEPSL